MNKLLKTALVILALLILIGSLAAWFLPTAVEALPGQVRGRLPEQFLRAVTTPLPAALPPPAATPAGVETIINEINQSPVPKTEPVEVESVQVEPATPSPEAEPVEAKLATPTPKAEPVEAVPVEADPATRHPPPATPTQAAEPVEAELVEAEPVEPATRHSPLATPLTPPYPPQTKLEGLEIVPQKLNNCGPATLSINLNYYGLQQTQFDVAQVVKPHYDDRNVSPEELVDYTNEYTELRAALFRGGSLDLAKQLIAAGFPVVIEKGYEPDEWQGWMGHYLTLFGYDDKAQAFITMDTYLGPWDSNGRSYSYEEIETGWQQFNHTFYIVYEPEQEQTLREITGPTFNDEQTMWQQTITQAQADIEQDPQNAFAWFNLGSSLTNLGQLIGRSSSNQRCRHSL